MGDIIMNEKAALVSIIIPVKRSQRTIRETVLSLLAQDYTNFELILVGDREDPTWSAITDLIATEPRLRVIEIDTSKFRGRDANFKRNVGLHAANGDWIALTDSDMVLPRDWVSKGVDILKNRGFHCAAGPMISIDGRATFWGAYVDLNVFGSKTPRVHEEIVITPENFGSGKGKPPVTANVFITRELYNVVGDLDPDFIYSYEDYEWFWQMTKAGYDMLHTPVLAAEHHHRNSWKKLLREYYEAGRGCAHLVWKDIGCPLSLERMTQLFVITAFLIAAAFYPLELISLAAAGLLMLGFVTHAMIKRSEGILFPFVTAALGLSFCWGLGFGLVRGLENFNPIDEIVKTVREMPRAASMTESRQA